MKVVCSILILLCCMTSSFPQQTNKDITKEEEQEALRIARLFEKRMRQTRDISPLIEELFVQDFLQRYRDYNKAEKIFAFRNKFSKQISEKDLMRFYVGFINLVYLSHVYYFSHVPSTTYAPAIGVPRAVIREVKECSFCAAVLGVDKQNNNDEGDEGYISAKQFIRYTKIMERLVLKFRPYMKRSAEKTTAYKKSQEDFHRRFHTFEPWVIPCDDDCVGFPKGTRFIYVTVMPFQLQLVRYKGQMKVLIAYMYFD